MSLAQCQYIAAGFVNDAERLLADYIKDNSTDFTVFVKAWRKHSFSLIYMGRNSEKDLGEFTQEIFYLSANFLASSSLMHQVGGIYLLYALYRNQILNPPVRIRIEVVHFAGMLTVRQSMSPNEHRSLHYVIDYLMENCLDFVSCRMLMGPFSGVLCEEHDTKDTDRLLKLEAGMKSSMLSLSKSNVLQEMSELLTEYSNTKRLLNLPGIDTGEGGGLDKYIAGLDVLLDRKKQSKDTKRAIGNQVKSINSIGSRRAKLKAQAFSLDAASAGNSKLKRIVDKNVANCDISIDDVEMVDESQTLVNLWEISPKNNTMASGSKNAKEQSSAHSKTSRRLVLSGPKFRRNRPPVTRHYYMENDTDTDLELSDTECMKLSKEQYPELFRHHESAEADDATDTECRSYVEDASHILDLEF